MITNTDNSILPAGISGANRTAVNPMGSTVSREIRGTGPSANADTAVMASVKQGSVASDTRADTERQNPIQSDKSMEEVADALNRTFGEKQSLQFSVDKDTGVSVIKVTQAGTGEVVRQIPNEEALSMLQRLDSQQDSGDNTAVLFDQMA